MKSTIWNTPVSTTKLFIGAVAILTAIQSKSQGEREGYAVVAFFVLLWAVWDFIRWYRDLNRF